MAFHVPVVSAVEVLTCDKLYQDKIDRQTDGRTDRQKDRQTDR